MPRSSDTPSSTATANAAATTKAGTTSNAAATTKAGSTSNAEARPPKGGRSKAGPAASVPTAAAPTAVTPSAAGPTIGPGESTASAATGAWDVASQRQALLAERATYVAQAAELQAQADSLALEHEPGDVQFDEEGGEGGTSSVDRELDLVLSAQARSTVEEIDRALAKIDTGTYGRCEQCGRPIPQARLEALPHAAMCVTCKAGGLASRR